MPEQSADNVNAAPSTWSIKTFNICRLRWPALMTEFLAVLTNFVLVTYYISSSQVPVEFIVLAILSLHLTFTFRGSNLCSLSNADRLCLWVYFAGDIILLGLNLAVSIWGLSYRLWAFAVVLPFFLLPYIFFLVVRLEMLFGARYRNATPRTLLKSENVTWNDVKTIRFFSLPPLPPIFQKFKDLRTQLNLRKFNPETGIYSRVWTPKSTAILLRNRLRQKQGPQANV